MDACPHCGATRSNEPGWCGLCYAPNEAVAGGRTEAQALVVVTGSGELSFPIWMRILMSVAVLVGGLLLIVGFEPWWTAARPLWALGSILLVTYAVLGGVLTARLWAPGTFGRREERVVLLDRAKIEEVEQRHRSLHAGGYRPVRPTG
jgi:hypothetical protein